MSIGKSSISRAEKAAASMKATEGVSADTARALRQEEAEGKPAAQGGRQEFSTGEAELAYLPTAEIFSAYAPGNTVCASLWHALIASVEKYGVIEPIVVRQVDGEYRVISGHKRLFAAKSLGLSQIPARIVRADDRLARELTAEVSAFTLRLPYEPAERAAAVSAREDMPDYLL